MLHRTTLRSRANVLLMLLTSAASLMQQGCASRLPTKQVTVGEYASERLGGSPTPGVVAVIPIGIRVDSRDDYWIDLMIQGQDRDAHRVAEYIAHSLAFTDHPSWYVLLWEPGKGSVALSTALTPPRSATFHPARPVSYVLSNDGESASILQPVRIKPARPLRPGAIFSVSLNRSFDDELDESLDMRPAERIPCRRADLVPDR